MPRFRTITTALLALSVLLSHAGVAGAQTRPGEPAPEPESPPGPAMPPTGGTEPAATSQGDDTPPPAKPTDATSTPGAPPSTPGVPPPAPASPTSPSSRAPTAPPLTAQRAGKAGTEAALGDRAGHAAGTTPHATVEQKPKENSPAAAPSAIGDGDHQFTLRTLVQGQGRFFLAGNGTDALLVRRARLGLRARLFQHFDLVIEPELANSTLTLLEAYGILNLGDAIQLRVGKSKVPLGLEHLQSSAATTFAELGLPSELLPNRDIGIQLQGRLFDGTVSYAAGVYNGTPAGAAGDLDENSSKDVAGRLFVLPLKPAKVPELAGLGLGVAGAVGRQNNALPSYKSFSRQTFFQYVKADTTTGTSGAVADGERRIFSPQAYYYLGPIGVLGEYVWTRQNVTNGGSTARVAADAWQVAASVVVGGKPSYEGVKVDHPFSLERSTWGALELVARYGELHVRGNAYQFGLARARSAAERAPEWVVGLGWHFAPLISCKLELNRTRFDWHDVPSARPDETILLGQLQVASQ
jgi:phosphate-selective porin OprO/OprP